MIAASIHKTQERYVKEARHFLYESANYIWSSCAIKSSKAVNGLESIKFSCVSKVGHQGSLSLVAKGNFLSIFRLITMGASL